MFLASAVIHGIYYPGEQSLLPQNPNSADLQQMVCLYATCAEETYNNTAVCSKYFPSKTGSLGQKLNFRQESKFLLKIEFLGKNLNFHQKLNF